MGTIKKGIIGGFSGKVGPVIGSSWKGKPYMKARPEKVANPRTKGQLNHRGLFIATVRFLSPLKDFIRAGFTEMAIDQTAFNAAVSWNYRHAVTGAYPDFTFDYSKLLMSQGTLAGAWNPQVRASGGQVHFTWQNNADNMEVMDSDRTLVMVYNATRQKSVFVIGGNTRDSGHQSVELPDCFMGNTLHCYLSFQSSDQSAASTSQWLGSMVVN